MKRTIYEVEISLRSIALALTIGVIVATVIAVVAYENDWPPIVRAISIGGAIAQLIGVRFVSVLIDAEDGE